MNNIYLKGTIRNIGYSHSINNVQYDKADLIVPRETGEDDILQLRFKQFSNNYSEGQQIELTGNIRSYSHKTETGKNKVDIYVFTYFDDPGDELVDSNYFEVTGRVCKMNPLHTSTNGKSNLHFVLANNIISSDGNTKINTYIPLVCWGTVAKECAGLHVSDIIKVKGQLHSRTYKKYYENGDMEILTAHEGVVQSVELLEKDEP